MKNAGRPASVMAMATAMALVLVGVMVMMVMVMMMVVVALALVLVLVGWCTKSLRYYPNLYVMLVVELQWISMNQRTTHHRVRCRTRD